MGAGGEEEEEEGGYAEQIAATDQIGRRATGPRWALSRCQPIINTGEINSKQAARDAERAASRGSCRVTDGAWAGGEYALASSDPQRNKHRSTRQKNQQKKQRRAEQRRYERSRGRDQMQKEG